MRAKSILCYAVMCLACVDCSLADVIILKIGLVYQGKVEESNSVTIKFQRSGFLIPYPIQTVRDIYVDSDITPTFAPLLEKIDGPGPRELPEWGHVITRLAKQPWATDIRQIPSPVGEGGVFKHVPYTSFRCGYGMYEVDVYGDPQRPAAFEI